MTRKELLYNITEYLKELHIILDIKSLNSINLVLEAIYDYRAQLELDCEGTSLNDDQIKALLRDLKIPTSICVLSGQLYENRGLGFESGYNAPYDIFWSANINDCIHARASKIYKKKTYSFESAKNAGIKKLEAFGITKYYLDLVDLEFLVVEDYVNEVYIIKA